ncbi:MAG: YHYH protein [Actinobacteria bacterium]|nr:YHYH protein [Actinomycetota bacterium]
MKTSTYTRLGYGLAATGLIAALAGCGAAVENTAATSEPAVVEDDSHTHEDGTTHTHDSETDADTDAVAVGDLEAYLDAYSANNDNVDISYDDESIRIQGNGVPDFETGAFPNSGNPNSISEQDIDVTVTRNPTWTGEAVEVREPGMSLASVKFEPGTAERDPQTGAPIEAFNDIMDLGLDQNNAHVQPNGQYHFHADPSPLSDSDGTEHSALVGFMYDGYPVYTLYGYGAQDEVDGTVSEMQSSWQLKSGERSEGEPDGTYDGTYTTDYEFVEGSGDLDECNGIWTVTPEYPEGTYAYFITDEFPYISRCLNGEFDQTLANGGQGGMGQGQGPGGQGPGGQGPMGPGQGQFGAPPDRNAAAGTNNT